MQPVEELPKRRLALTNTLMVDWMDFRQKWLHNISSQNLVVFFALITLITGDFALFQSGYEGPNI